MKSNIVKKILKFNNLLSTDDRVNQLIKNQEYKLIVDYGKDEKLLVRIPYIPLFETKPQISK